MKSGIVTKMVLNLRGRVRYIKLYPQPSPWLQSFSAVAGTSINCSASILIVGGIPSNVGMFFTLYISSRVLKNVKMPINVEAIPFSCYALLDFQERKRSCISLIVILFFFLFFLPPPLRIHVPWFSFALVNSWALDYEEVKDNIRTRWSVMLSSGRYMFYLKWPEFWQFLFTFSNVVSEKAIINIR